MPGRFRIYADESGTHSDDWLIIGMLFVPNHGALHSELLAAKEAAGYWNRSPRRNARYKETHLVGFRSESDVRVARSWIDSFVKHSCYYRCVVVDWSIWDGSYFGDAFEAEALKKRRAYKKWAEMLLHPELKDPTTGVPIYHARLFLDRLNILHGYDVLPHLQERFSANYKGQSPYIDTFDYVDSWRDAHQCLQLCDLLTGCVHQTLTPAGSVHKIAVRDYLADELKKFGVSRLAPEFWKGYAPNTLTRHLPKFSAWFWRPSKKANKPGARRGGGR